MHFLWRVLGSLRGNEGLNDSFCSLEGFGLPLRSTMAFTIPLHPLRAIPCYPPFPNTHLDKGQGLGSTSLSTDGCRHEACDCPNRYKDCLERNPTHPCNSASVLKWSLPQVREHRFALGLSNSAFPIETANLDVGGQMRFGFVEVGVTSFGKPGI
jgi:hypothetical protein